MQEKIVSAKTRLLKLGAVSCRGTEATSTQLAEASELVKQLRETGSSDSTNLEGSWQLVLSSTQPFRSSPFFWTVGQLMGDRADFFYAAHAHQTSLFGGGIGEVINPLPDREQTQLLKRYHRGFVLSRC